MTRTVGVYSRAACRGCNSGFMSEIEESAKPLLVPVMRGVPASWGPEEQKAVAAWCFKTALMADTSNPAARKAPVEHFEFLFEHHVPPPSAQIRVGRYHPRVGEKAHGVMVGVGTGPEWVGGSYRVTFSVGQIVFVVHGRGGLDPLPHVEMAFVTGSGLYVPGGSTFTKFWPSRSETFEWPHPDGIPLGSQSLLGLADTPVTVAGHMAGSA
jgi:hypothetical protein